MVQYFPIDLRWQWMKTIIGNTTFVYKNPHLANIQCGGFAEEEKSLNIGE